MSDTPLSPGWWQAGDGRWYPPPPGLTDEMPARAPTPPPDHPPYPFDPAAYGPSAPLAPTPRPQRSRRRPLMLVIAAIAACGALLLGLGITFLPSSSKTASSSDPRYQEVVAELLDSELTNLVFLETFWDSYARYREEVAGTSGSERAAIANRWLSEIESQVEQFQLDLQAIDEQYASRPFDDGTIPDSVRDLAMNHYRAWQQWASEILPIAKKWLEDRTSTLSLSGYITEVRPALETSIETTFTALCATLDETQPTDGTYMQTIYDICSTS